RALSVMLGAFFAIVTEVCTGMIYAWLPSTRSWHQSLVAPVYVALALACGAVVLSFLLLLFGSLTNWAPWLAVVTLAAAWILKAASWAQSDEAARSYTVEQATGLGRFGKVRPLDPPHTQPNYVMREMGFEIGR